MSRRKLNPKDNRLTYKLDMSVTVVREPSIVDNFYVTEGVCPDDGNLTVAYNDPLIMLFNQERLDQMGDAAVKMWIDSMSVGKDTAMSELKSKLSDDDLIALVKSRHIQNPSELQAYVEWCNENVDEFNAQLKEVQQMQAAEAAAKVEQPTQVDNTKTT